MAKGLRTSPWIIMGTTIILIVVVVALAVQNTRRDRRYMSQMLKTNGAALIRAVEAGARTGMMGMMWGGSQIQRLLEETAQLPDVRYMAVVDTAGRVLAHSDPDRIGQPFRLNDQIIHLGSDFEENWEVITLAAGQKVFEVHRHFHPFPPGWRSRGRSEHMMPLRNKGSDKDWFDPQKAGGQLIVIGLNMAPIEQVISVNIRNTILLSVVLLLLGIAGVVSLFWMQSYRATRRSLQDTSAFADEVVAHLPVGVIATDQLGRIAFFNSAAGNLSGLAPPSVLGQDPDKIMPPGLCGLKDLLDDGQVVKEREMECVLGGTRVAVSISATRILNETGQLVGYVLIFRDLAEVRRLQAEIRRQEKLAALGGLAAGVAHEIRNPLSSIKGLATYFAGKFPSQSEDRNLALVMTQEVDRLNRVVSELLEFARPSELKQRSYDLNVLLNHCLQLVRQDAAGKKIDVQQKFSDALCPVFIDPDRFSQCLLNLFLNGIEAMQHGGHLTISSDQLEDHWVRIQICDTGPGIPKEDAEKIFNPYFTTKANGTGLGLAVVHKIVEAHGGRIQVESSQNTGTCFVLHLPCGPTKESGGA